MCTTGSFHDETNTTIKLLRNRQKPSFIKLSGLGEAEQQNWNKLNVMMGKLATTSWNAHIQYGFEVLGPLLFGFSKWLHEIVTSQKVDHLFFLSRDGFLLLKVYKELYPDDSTPASYLYVSRKVVREAQLWLKPDLCEVYKLFPKHIYLERGEFCTYLNVEGEEALRVWEDCGLPEKMRFLPGELLRDQRLADFYERMKPLIIEKSRESYSRMMIYLRQNHFNGKVGVVDIGWKGTIQNCLETILQNDEDVGHEIVGFYLGLTQEAAKTKNKFSFIPAEEAPQEFVAGLVEYPFLAPEGSLLGYVMGSDGSLTLEMANYENDQAEHEVIKSMQAGALRFVRCARDFPPEEFTWGAAFSYANLKRLSKHPTLQEVKIFGDLSYYDGGKRQIAAPRSLAHYLLHPRDFPYDLSVSGWRIGFLKRFLKVGIDYNQLLKIYKNTHKV